MRERWKKHPEYSDHEISNLGRVRRYLKPFLMSNGYPHVSLGAIGKRAYLHNLVIEAFIGPRPQGMQTRHLDGNKLNARLDNLRYGTPSENLQDRWDHGKGNVGSRHGMSKLTEQDVGQIRAKYKQWRVTMKTLADEYKVGPDTIKTIVTGKRWCHVPLGDWRSSRP